MFLHMSWIPGHLRDSFCPPSLLPTSSKPPGLGPGRESIGPRTRAGDWLHPSSPIRGPNRGDRILQLGHRGPNQGSESPPPRLAEAQTLPASHPDTCRAGPGRAGKGKGSGSSRAPQHPARTLKPGLKNMLPGQGMSFGSILVNICRRQASKILVQIEPNPTLHTSVTYIIN